MQRSLIAVLLSVAVCLPGLEARAAQKKSVSKPAVRSAARRAPRAISAKERDRVAKAKAAAARSAKAQSLLRCRPCQLEANGVSYEINYHPSPEPAYAPRRSPSYFWVRASRPEPNALFPPAVSFAYSLQGRPFDPDMADQETAMRKGKKVSHAQSVEAQRACMKVIGKSGDCLSQLFWSVPSVAAP